jgi:regulatory protein
MVKSDSVKSRKLPVEDSVTGSVKGSSNSSSYSSSNSSVDSFTNDTLEGFIDEPLESELGNCVSGSEAAAPPQSSEKDTLKAIRHKAFDLLARREHSRVELQRKLLSRYNEYALVDQVLERLRSENLQSDQRFAQSYVKYRTEAGFGPLRLRQELRERGVSDSLLSECVQPNSEHWFIVAQQVKRKKFGEEQALDLKQKAKQVRFMQHRGFGSAHIDNALAGNMTCSEEPA